MGYSLNIIQDSITYDVSDYVTNISAFPYYARNEDYVPINDDMSFNLSKNYLNIFPSVIFNIDSTVLIYSASVLLFNGQITETGFSNESLEYDFIVEQKIQQLKQFIMSIDDMRTEVSESAALFDIYTHPTGTPFITVDNLIDTIFAKIGISLDFSERDDTQTIPNVPILSSSLTVFGGDTIAFFLPNTKPLVPGNLYLYTEQLFSIGQEFALIPEQVNFSEEFRPNRVSLYDLLSKLNIMTGYNFIPKDETTFWVVNNRTHPERSVNFDISFNSFTETPETKGVTLDYIVPYRDTFPFPSQGWGYYNFIPWAPVETPDWYVGVSGQEDVIDFPSSYYNAVETEEHNIDWINQLIFWELPSIGGGKFAANIVMPTLNVNPNSLLTRIVESKMWESFTQQYDNLVNTERVAITENYITIDRNDDKNTFSSIKTTVFSTSTPEGAG